MTMASWRGPVFGARSMEELRKHWVLFLCLGILLMVLGVAAVGAAFVVTMATVVVFGALLLGGGILEIVRSIWARKSGGFTMHLLSGILYGIVGALMLAHPGAAALTLTLMLAVLFGVGGIFRIVTASSLRYRGWGWTLFSGIVAILLSAALISSWPISGLWAIGAFVGIDMICYGWSTIVVSVLARSLVADRAEPGDTLGRAAA